MCSPGHIFFWRFLYDKSCDFFLLYEFFPYFQDKILYYIFMTIFIFYEALKNSRVFLFHLIQLLIIMLILIKKFDGSYISF